jgi:hypothetical protein
VAECLEQRHRKRILVGLAIARVTAQHLGRHVRWRAGTPPQLLAAGLWLVLEHEPTDPKVGDACMPIGGDQHVRWFEVVDARRREIWRSIVMLTIAGALLILALALLFKRWI